MALRRGFKAEANQLSRDLRKELGLKYSDPLDPFDLASHLEIPIVRMSDFKASAPSVSHFENGGQSEFSAATIILHPNRIIIHNDSHTPGRQSSNLAHELSHSLLMHPAAAPLNEWGCRNWDQTIEDEAEWLAGALLISEEAALRIVRDHLAVTEAAQLYNVSEQMVRFRLNVTGAMRRYKKQ